MRRRAYYFGLVATAGLAVVLCLQSPTPAIAQAPPSAVKEAQKLYREGAGHFKARRFREASEFFQRAYNLDPSPILLYNLARAAEELGDASAAVSHYKAYLARYPEAEDRPEVERRIRVLDAILQAASKPRVGSLSIGALPPGATITIDGSPAPPPTDDGSWQLAPGMHEVRVSVPGAPDWTRKAEFKPSEATRWVYSAQKTGTLYIDGAPPSITVMVNGEPAPKPGGDGGLPLGPGAYKVVVSSGNAPDWATQVEIIADKPAHVMYGGEATHTGGQVTDEGMSTRALIGWISAGSGVGLFGAATYFQLSAYSAADDFDTYKQELVVLLGQDPEAENPETRAKEAQRDDAADVAQRDGTIGVACWIAGGVAVAAGGTLLTLEYLDGSGSKAAADEPTVTWVPYPGGIGVVGRF